MEFSYLVSAVIATKGIFATPLFWFLAVGALLFVVDRHVHTNTAPAIVITAGDVQRLEDQWRAQTGQSATFLETENLVSELVLEKRLAAEARALGLDRDDVIVQRRLAQKLRFLMQEQSGVTAPTEQSLRAFFAARIDHYRLPATLSFRHVYLDPGHRHAHAKADASNVLKTLQEGATADWRRFGDSFESGRSYTSVLVADVARDFGRQFANTLSDLDANAWQGPLLSARGWHVAILDNFTPEREPVLEEVRSRVEHDFRQAQQTESLIGFRNYLRSKYPVSIETDKPAPALVASEIVN